MGRPPTQRAVQKFVVITLAIAVSSLWVAVIRADHRVVQTAGEPTTPLETPSAEASTAETTAVFIGDSYTSGTGSTGGGFVPLVADHFGWAVVNLSQGGTGFVTKPFDPEASCGSNDCLNYQQVLPLVERELPDVVVVSGGRNDLSASSVEVAAAVPAFFEELRLIVPDATIIVTSPVWDARQRPEALGLIAELEKVAVDTHGDVFVDLEDPFAGREELISSDSFHPNDDGYELMARLIIEGVSEQRPPASNDG